MGFIVLPVLGRGVFDGRFDVAWTSLTAFGAYAVVLVLLDPERQKRASTEPAGLPWSTGGRITRRELIGGGFFLLASAVLVRTAIGKLPSRPGINPEGLPEPITPSKSFYIVSKNLFDPQLRAKDWRLKVDGLVETSLNLSYEDVTAMPSEEFVRTLECISNEVGGDLISTGQFTGVRLSEVLKRVKPRSEAQVLHFTSVDGYTENMSLEKALDPDTFLVYRLNGEPLPFKHGYPLRVLGAGTYGMKNPKWLNRIEVTNSAPDGFWERQGWNPDAIVQTMSRIDSPRRTVAAGAVTVQGIAFAGDRGIQGVEVSRDDGRTWTPAALLPPLGPLTWVFWQHMATLPAGTYNLVVRAMDGSGNAQVERETSTYPEGATGYHRLRIQVSDRDVTAR
jgi:DMSO/TMAO reductase YedYZ molybdopterin-dependent catalytic subunit